MPHEEVSQQEKPLLICIPGLLGGAEDFTAYLPELRTALQVVVIDPNAQRRQIGLAHLTAEILQEVSYDTTAREITKIIEQVGCSQAFLLGISLGGKVVYDFAIRYPEKFLGGFITDVGPGPFEESELYQVVDQIVEKTDLNLSWPEVKKSLQERIGDRNMRTLIQTQISYPHQGKPPGVWKTAMKGFGEMLQRQQLGDQFAELEKKDESLVQQKSFFHIFSASQQSGISRKSLAQLRRLKAARIHDVPQSSHFLHITHKAFIIETILEACLERFK